MPTNLEVELFLKSKDLWGMQSQILMLAEEASELCVATLHLDRANKDKAEAWENFAEEIADVEFMIAEMKEYFPVLNGKVNLYRRMKAERLDRLIITSEKVSVSSEVNKK
jgi:NTP pyrophosphatase (non-canonical NTP hydrolase)